MDSNPVQTVLSRFPDARATGQYSWSALCPAHEDRNASLIISRGDDGRCLIHCHAGCATRDVVSAMGLSMADLMPDNGDTRTDARPSIVKTYGYVDAEGTLAYQVARYSPKGFKQRRPDGSGGYIWNLNGVQRILYRLPELLDAGPESFVFVCEGEKDVDNLVDAGLIATTAPQGAGKWSKVDDSPLHGRHVCIIPDNDHGGHIHAQDIAKALHGKAASVRILDLPGVGVKGDVSDWLDAGGDGEELVVLAEAAALWKLTDGPDVVEAEQRPLLIVTGRPVQEIAADAIDALRKANDPPRLFIRSGEIVRVDHDEEQRPIIRQADEYNIRHELGQAVQCVRILKTDESVVHVWAPLDLVRDIAATPDLPLPALRGIIEAPTLRPDGTVITEPGYDQITKLLYEPAPGLEVPTIPDDPNHDDAIKAVKMVAEAIGEFPYDSDASRANAYAALVTPVVRQYAGGNVPLGLIDAPQAGTGKSLEVEVVALIVTGRASSLLTAMRDDAEMEKRITTALDNGSTVINIDNLDQKLWHPSLSAALTRDVWESRRLGSNTTIRVPQRASWYCTGNNIRLGGDLPRRCYWVRMDAKAPRPWERLGFRHPDLLEWVTQHRGQLIAALLTMARAWIVAGRPVGDNPVIGSFEGWC